VAAARRLQDARLAGGSCGGCNATLSPDALRRLAVLDREGRTILDLAIRRLGLSARAHDGVLRVARTIADLEGGGPIRAAHVAEAAQYRALDRDRPDPD
jgi:magnesium chelatase family protein